MHVAWRLDTGGVAELLFLTAKFNLRERYDLVFVTSGTPDGVTSRRIRSLGYPVHGLDISGRALDLRMIPRLRRVILDYRPQIIHLYTKVNVLGRVVAKAFGVPVVICNEVDLLGRPGSNLQLRLVVMLKRRMSFFADHVMACSEAVRAYWQRGPADKYSVVYLPIAPEYFERSEEAVLSSRGRSFAEGGAPLIGVVSRVDPGKGHEDLLRAMPVIRQSIPTATLRIVGSGSLLTEMKELSTRLELDGYVEFAGYVEDLAPELAAMDLFVLPSLSEGFPLSILEAMASCVPVAATPVGGVPEMLGEGERGVLFPPENPAGLAEAVVSILADPSRARGMAQRGRAWATENCSPEVYVGLLHAAYQRLLARKAIQ